MSEKKNTGKKAVIAVIVIALIVVIIALAVVISTGTPMDKLHGGAKRMAQRAQQRQAPRPAARRCEADSLT